MSELLAKHPAGLIGICTGPVGRYRDFDWCVDKIIAPLGSVKQIQIGLEIPFNYNELARATLAARLDWLWLLDDDHVFPPDLLLNLLGRNVDIVTPLYLRRRPPFLPVLHGDATRKFVRYNFNYLRGQTGLVDLTADGAAPTGGMLIRRRVLEKMADPWFEYGQINTELGSWDIYFCEKARQAGFSLYVDADNTMGHLIHVAVWPIRDAEGIYSPDIRMPNAAADYPNVESEKQDGGNG